MDKNSLSKVSPQQLIESKVPNSQVNAIWVRFKSKKGRRYTAVHVFSHIGRHPIRRLFPYILLSSEDKDEKDFKKVYREIMLRYRGRPEDIITGGIYDRGSDICRVICLSWFPFSVAVSQKSIAKLVMGFYWQNFSEVSISKVYFSKTVEDLQTQIAFV